MKLPESILKKLFPSCKNTYDSQCMYINTAFAEELKRKMSIWMQISSQWPTTWFTHSNTFYPCYVTLFLEAQQRIRHLKCRKMSSPKLGHISGKNNVSCFTLVCYIKIRKPGKRIAHFSYTNYMILNSLSMGANPIQLKHFKKPI